MDQYPSVAEARKWLRGNRNPSAFASNRFATTANALAFVDALYAAGAAKVMAENINDTDGAGGPYADSMLVYLPSDPAKRAAVFQVINEIGRPDTDGGPFMDDGEETAGLWWD